MTELDPKIRALVLNTNLYSPTDQATDGINDPGDQFQWMQQILSDACSNKERVSLGNKQEQFSPASSMKLSPK